jgi:hypothetical protein
MVVVCAWMFDLALGTLLSAGRFDIGFAAGRLYGLFAASIVQVVLHRRAAPGWDRLAEASDHGDTQRRARTLA